MEIWVLDQQHTRAEKGKQDPQTPVLWVHDREITPDVRKLETLAKEYSADTGVIPSGTLANIVIRALDKPFPAAGVETRLLTERLTALSLIFGPRFAPTGEHLGVKSKRTIKDITYGGKEPIVVIGTTGDPATPLKHAESLKEKLGNAVLLQSSGTHHCAYPYSYPIRAEVDKYFTTGDITPNFEK